MAASVRVQRVDRDKSRSFYVNLPIVLAEAMGIQKGEVFVWSLKDKNTLIFSRLQAKERRTPKKRRA